MTGRAPGAAERVRSGALARFGLCAALLLAPFTGCATAPDPAPASALLVLRGVTLIDGTDRPHRANVDVVIDGTEIVGIHSVGDRDYPATARVMDLPGRYIMPGLIDTHAHVTVLLPERGADGATRMVYRRDLSERVLRILLAHGVTTVRNPSAPAEAGVALRDDVERGLPGPRIVTSGEHMNNALMTDEEIRAEVRRQAAVGVDMIKVYASLRPGQVAAVISEAHRSGLPVVGHLQITSWTEAARLGIDAITHGAPWTTSYLPADRRPEYRPSMLGRLDWIEWLDPDGPEITEMIRELAVRGIPVDPTLVTYHTKFFGDDPRWTEHPDQALVPEIAAVWRDGHSFVADWTAANFARARSLWPKMEALIRRYHEGGVLLTAGSDLPNAWTIPGVSLHEELELLVAAGIPAPDVIRIATRNGADALRMLDERGTVEVGKRADLLVLSANPLADIRNTRSIELVIRDGAMFRPAELHGDRPLNLSQLAAPAEQSGMRALNVAVPVDARTDSTNLLLYIPRDRVNCELLPTVLYLHGGSHRGNDLQKLKEYGPPRMLAEGAELPYILIAPQLPDGEIWSDAAALIGLVDELRRTHPIDPDRLYVTGMSMGGRGAWYLAYRYPDRFAAVAPVAAFQPITYWASSGRLGRLPVRAFHGSDDLLAPHADAVRMHEAALEAGGTSELKTLVGRDHFIADVLEDPTLYEWLLQHRRKAVPRP